MSRINKNKPDLAEELATSLRNDRSQTNRKRWAQRIAGEKISITSLAHLVTIEKTTAMHFAWLLGEICTVAPSLLYDALPVLYGSRHLVHFKTFDRSLAKMFYYAGIPPQLEGEIVDRLFKWLLDPRITVSTKHYCVLTLEQCVLKHPELKPELIASLLDQQNKNTVSFTKLAGKMLLKLGRIR